MRSAEACGACVPEMTQRLKHLGVTEIRLVRVMATSRFEFTVLRKRHDKPLVVVYDIDFLHGPASIFAGAQTAFEVIRDTVVAFMDPMEWAIYKETGEVP